MVECCNEEEGRELEIEASHSAGLCTNVPKTALPFSLRPFLILVAALFSQICAGTPYWWPAISQGLKRSLALSDAQTVAIVAAANSGSTLGFIGGFTHERYGSRATACLGSVGIGASFLTLAVLTSYPLPQAIAYPGVSFWICLAASVSCVTFSFMLYSSCMCTAVAVFPLRYRGRIVGLCSGMYGASAGVFGCLQSAFFPSVDKTPHLLYFASAVCFVPAIVVGLYFPRSDKYILVVEPETEYSLLQSREADSYSSTESVTPRTALGSGEANDTTRRLGAAYCIAWALVLSLQIAAAGDWVGVSRGYQILCGLLMAVALSSFFLLPPQSTARISIGADEQQAMSGRASNALYPFSYVAKDKRYLYLCFGFFAVVGGAIAVLVQAPNLVASRLYSNTDGAPSEWNSEVVGKLVRSLVVVFSACNVSARLLIGSIMDWGETATDREMWKYTILVTDTLLMTISIVGVAFARSWALYTAVGAVGFCLGAWFSSAPALCSIWFGVASFPRDFGLLGPFTALGSATLASVVPAFMSRLFASRDSWIALPANTLDTESTARACTSLLCFAPPFCLLALLVFAMFAMGYGLRDRVLIGSRTRSSSLVYN